MMPDNYGPNDKSNMEPAEGSRENVNPDPADVNLGSATDSPMERGGGQVSQPDKPLPRGGIGREGQGGAEKQPGDGSAQPGAGITNRPLEEEREKQEDLPPRGETKSE